ncbi:MAG TPA: 4-hydroxy-3-methylbut-2-enyl diphosphate reductase [Verrucomicrobiales bacterium]|jgi:4-hydroxy-3-methylbut-2-enyl diphosphate reductase|nr:4-hydroxy-3-methylbut-2-enyl diphosphate reductase [Verrucomicrobiales bacterium]
MPPAVTQPKRVNVRTPEVMPLVQAEVESHYRSGIVERIRAAGGTITVGNTTVKLARQFGFCYGVERAIDLAYAARKVFADRHIYLLGEIIHNPEVNRQLRDMDIRTMPSRPSDDELNSLSPEDVVIVPAFGAETAVMERIASRGCATVDTTCGDVMSVWRRVREYARSGRTSIIHGKASHEETRATASRALGESGGGHYLVILTMADCDVVCDYIRNGGDSEAFLKRFAGSYSPGFDPNIHLKRIGVANQTTMLKSETEEIQRRLQQAVAARDEDRATDSFAVFDTICGATQERQDALFEMLKSPMDLMLVIGGYNSSNTTHLVEIAEQQLPTFFIRDAGCIKDLEEIVHFDLHQKSERTGYTAKLTGNQPVTIGITAGASCPNNLIEETILRIFALRGVSAGDIEAAA